MTDEEKRKRKRELDRRYHAANRAKINARHRERYRTSRKKVNERCRQYKANNRDKIREMNRAYYRQYREEVRENMSRRIRVSGMHMGMAGMTRKQMRKFIDGVNNGKIK